MSKKLLTFVAPLLIFLISYFSLPSKGHEPKVLNLVTTGSQSFKGQNSLRVFNNRERSKYTDYYILTDNYNLQVADQPIWGFCFLNNIKYKSATINSQREPDNTPELLKLSPVLDSSDKCQFISKIKKFNQRKNYPAVTAANLTTALGLSLIFTFFVWLMYQVQSSLKESSESKSEVKFYCFFTLISFGIIYGWYLLSYPGLFDIDIYYTYHESILYNIGDWFSYLNNLIFRSILNISKDISFFSFPTMLIILIMEMFYFKLLRNLKFSRWVAIPILLLLCIPSVGFWIHYLNRDLLSCLASLTLALYIPYRCLKEPSKLIRKIDLTDIFFISIACFVSTIRRDGMITATMFIISFLLLTKFSKKTKIQVIIITLLFKAIFFSAGNYMAAGSSRRHKILTSLSHHIGTFLAVDYKTDSKEKDKELISKFYKFDMLIDKHKDNVAEHALLGAVDHSSTTPLLELYKLDLKLIFNNPLEFLKSRVKMFFYTFGPSTKTFLYAKDIAKPNLHQESENIVGFHNMKKTSFPGLQAKGLDLLNRQHQYIYRLLFYNGSLSLVICLIVMFSFKTTPISSLTSLVLLARLPILFFLLPVAQFKYVFDIYLLGFLIIPIYIYEYRKNKGYGEFML
jgi:hypothetical protein